MLPVFFTSGLVLWHAGILHVIDKARKKGEEEIKILNLGLERKVEERTRELQEAMDQIKQLRGMIPVCAWCKKVLADPGSWQTLEAYLSAHTDATITHGICPACFDSAKPSGRENDHSHPPLQGPDNY